MTSEGGRQNQNLALILYHQSTMPEPLYVPVFSKFTLREMIDHAPSPWFGVLGFILSRTGMMNTDQGNPAPNPVSEDLALFEDIPADFQQGVKKVSEAFEQMGFQRLSYMYNPRFPTVAGAYLLHQNQKWVAFVAVAKEPHVKAAQHLRRVYSLVGFTSEGHSYSVTTAPFLQVPHVSRLFLRKATPEQVFKAFERHVQGKDLKPVQNLQEVQESMDDLSMRSHRYLVTRGAKKALLVVADPEPESKDDPEDA